MSKHTPTPWNASCFVNRQSELWDACPANKLRDTWDVRTRDTDMAVTGWGCVEQSKETAARIVACVNAFHSPDGREIATENISEGLIWQLADALKQSMRQWKMHAEITEDRDLLTEDSAEGEMFRNFRDLRVRLETS